MKLASALVAPLVANALARTVSAPPSLARGSDSPLPARNRLAKGGGTAARAPLPKAAGECADMATLLGVGFGVGAPAAAIGAVVGGLVGQKFGGIRGAKVGAVAGAALPPVLIETLTFTLTPKVPCPTASPVSGGE